MRSLFAFAGLLGLVTPSLSAEYLMLLDSGSNKVHLASPQNGAINRPSFISLVNAFTPKHAMQVENRIWISDQVQDRIDIFNLRGLLLSTIGGTPTGELDNIRGMEYANGTVYVANAGTGNAAPGHGLVTFSPDGVRTGFWPVLTPTGGASGSPFAILDTGSGLFVAAGSGTASQIRKYSYSGVDQGVFTQLIRFPQQMIWGQNGNLFAAGFSLDSGASISASVFEFNSSGVAVSNTMATGLGPRSVYELRDGNFLIGHGSSTSAAGYFTYPRSDAFSTPIMTAITPHFIDELTIPELIGNVEIGFVSGTDRVLPATFEFRDATTGAVKDVLTVPLDALGNYSLEASVVPGTYDIAIRSSATLRRVVQDVVISGSSTNNVSAQLINGDIDQDNAIGLGDYLALAQYFDLTSASPDWLTPDGSGISPSLCDLDNGGAVDLSDYLVLAASFDVVGDE